MITPARNAPWKPVTKAAACVDPPATASSVRDVAIVDSAAIPNAPPICCDVLIRPDASPASAGSIPASAAIEIGTNCAAIADVKIAVPATAKYATPVFIGE